MCEVLGYKLTHNKRTDELFNVVKQFLNKKSAVIVLDEVDKLEELDILYSFLEEIYRKSIFLITNPKEWLIYLDQRIKSRLMADNLEFKPYSYTETKGILTERREVAFYANVWDDAAFEIITAKTTEMKDIRLGLYLMKAAGMIAENVGSKKITIDHAKQSLGKIDEFFVKDKAQLKDDTQEILDFIKENSGKKIGDLFKLYTQKHSDVGYKSFQRNIAKLAENNFISVEKTEGGALGNTTIVRCDETTKKLTDF